MAAAARPYKLFGSHERAALASVLEARARAWAQSWLPAAAKLQVQSAPASELSAPRLAGEDWLVHSGASGASIALGASEEDRQGLGVALCGPGSRDRSALAASIAPDAFRDLAATLLGEPVSQGRRGGTPARAVAGSASYAARIVAGASSFTLVIDAARTLELLKSALPRPAAASLAGRRAALDAQRVELRVLAGAAELEIGLLRDLRPGHVIALDTRLDQPVSLTTAEGGTLCAVRLGAVADARAVALVREDRLHG